MVKPKHVEYQHIHLPPGKEPQDYTTHERRAEEYQMLIQAGTVRILNVNKLGARYGVSNVSISKDRRILESYLLETFNKANVLPEIITTKRWALRQARELGDYKTADKICDGILEMCFNMGIIQKAPEVIDVRLEERYKSWFNKTPLVIETPVGED